MSFRRVAAGFARTFAVRHTDAEKCFKDWTAGNLAEASRRGLGRYRPGLIRRDTATLYGELYQAKFF